MQGGAFASSCTRTAFAAAREGGRYAMHGVLAETRTGDSSSSRPTGRAGARQRALPSGAVRSTDAARDRADEGHAALLRVISDPLETIQLSFDENQVGLRTKDAEIFARLLDGDFPKYAAVIPRDATNHVEATPSSLQQKLRLVANVTGAEARAVRFKLAPNDLELFGQSVGRGEARARMDVDFKGRRGRDRVQPRLTCSRV
jgi:DNA polymerase-3 subunit beta